jgi:two-component system, chemotaxis family, CheB/CheR fusion protein
VAQTTQSFPIVGIGASAGGVNALEGFLKGLPTDLGMAFVIVTHLNPERESHLQEVLSRFTSMNVVVATDELRIAPNCIYVLPPDAVLGIANGCLRLTKQSRVRPERKPVDIFLSSLAIDLGEYAISIVLSGGDGDGTLGTKAVKERGGLTFAQVADGHGPAQPDMPRSAISTGLVDFALPVGEMGRKLQEVARSFGMLEAMVANSSKTDDEAALKEAKDEIYRLILNQIGHDFSGYKTKTFLRRVARRMQVNQLDTIEGYVEKLRQDPREVGALYRDLLINVTNFFRDAAAFEKLEELVIPKLFEGRGADETVRIWVPGCATGEEVFSIAMLAREYMDRLTALPRVQIFATDIDDAALGVARAGRYPEALLDSVPEERRKRFFIKDGVSYVLSKDVRDLCIFSPHSIIRDPPFSRIDLVSCRNLLIYFGADVQNQVIPIFHYSLRPGGYLFLGTSENVSQFGDLFAAVDKKNRIFRSRDNGTQTVRLAPLLADLRPVPRGSKVRLGTPPPGGSFRSSVEMQVLERFAPAHVVANREGEIVHYSGKTGKYLEAPAGQPNRHIIAMARKGMRLDLRAAFREAVDKNDTVTREGIAVEGDDGRVQIVTVTVEPVWQTAGAEPLFLIIFSDQGQAISREEAITRAANWADGDLAHVERELRDTRERLQSMMEEYETALEELKSSNEELVSVNEELQSTNEELEASKEELQSLNEEMHTINAELASKVEALDQAHSDLQNLFESTEVATIFLDKALVIRTYTPAATEIFNILPSDCGRPITDLSSKLSLPMLESDIKQVFAGGVIRESKAISTDGHTHYFLRLLPYRSTDNNIEGVLLTFIDVSNLVKAEEGQRILIAELHHRTRNLLAVIQSIANQTIRTSSSLEVFKGRFNDRLAALSRVQGLISMSPPDALTIGALVRMELEALNAPSKRTVVGGPEILLPEEIVRTLALTLHELATNATKHGALSSEEGTLKITWAEAVREGGRRLELEWTETGVPVPLEKRNGASLGFGRTLIERALPFQLQAKTHYELGSDGVRCSISIPLPPADEP